MTINQIQDEIIQEFSLLDGDMEMTVFYIMELGQKLPAMPEEEKTEENIVKGCQSKVWLTVSNGWMIKFIFWPTAIQPLPKDWLVCLIRIYNGQTSGRYS